MVKKLLFILLLLLILSSFYLVSEEKYKILILPFENAGSMELDHFQTLIPQALYAHFRMIKKYKTILPEDLYDYQLANNFQIGDLQNKKTLFKIAKDFSASNILRGRYYEKENYLVVEYEVISSQEKKVIYRSKEFGKGGINSFDTIDDITTVMVEDFVGIKLVFGTIIANSDEKCRIFIDGEDFGETPFRKHFPVGKHKLEAFYINDRNKIKIYDKYVFLEKMDKKKVDIKVFTKLNIETEKPCNVYIDNDFKGETPYNDRLFSGKDYKLKLVYNDSYNNKNILDEKVLTTSDEKDIDLSYPMTGNITVKGIENENFQVYIADNNIEHFPATLENLPFGKYRIKAVLNYKPWKKELVFYNKRHYLIPGEKKEVILSGLKYKKYWGLCFIPGAAQIYNNHFAKGAVFLSAFLIGTALVPMSYFFSYSYHEYFYSGIVDEYNNKNGNSKYTFEEIDRLSYVSGYLFQGLLIGGISTAVFMLIVSFVDGIVNMNRIYKLFYPQKAGKKVLRIRIKPEIIIG